MRLATEEVIVPTANTNRHPESLLNIPLVAQMFADPQFKIIRRGVDARWHYNNVIASRIDGFNPLSGAVLIAKHSYFDRWYKHRHESARPFNSADKLISEVLFAVHDYLHAWSYRWIAELYPKLGFGTAPITPDNFEDMVFCHLLTEAIATVGLDYWYLSCNKLNDVVPIGTAHTGLTISYCQSLETEYRHFAPNFEVQTPDFLTTLTRFYCDGVFQGFAADDLSQSPVIYTWLKHELSYGQQQREYSRQWFAHLSCGKVNFDHQQLKKPVDHSSAFKTKLMHTMGELLWSKVKHDDLVSPDFQFDPQTVWNGTDKTAYHFTNYNKSRKLSKAAEDDLSDESFTYLLRQYVARFDYGEFPVEAHEVFKIMQKQRSLILGKTLLKEFPTHAVARHEPRDVFLYN